MRAKTRDEHIRSGFHSIMKSISGSAGLKTTIQRFLDAQLRATKKGKQRFSAADTSVEQLIGIKPNPNFNPKSFNFGITCSMDKNDTANKVEKSSLTLPSMIGNSKPFKHSQTVQAQQIQPTCV